jgi:hypothetical protein
MGNKARFIGIAVTALTVAVGCSSTPPYSAPQSFTVSNDAIVRVVHDVMDGESIELDGSPMVNCSGRTTCTISYTIKLEKGWLASALVDPDRQVIEPTRQIWKALFTDPQFQSGTITLSGPVKTTGGKTETGTYYTLKCDRGAASKIDWDNVDGKGVRTLCDYDAQAPGLPGYTGPTPPGN